MITTQTWLSNTDLLTFFEGEHKLKTREEPERNWQWLDYAQLTEKFNLDKKNFVFMKEKTELDLCAGDKHVMLRFINYYWKWIWKINI